MKNRSLFPRLSETQLWQGRNMTSILAGIGSVAASEGININDRFARKENAL